MYVLENRCKFFLSSSLLESWFSAETVQFRTGWVGSVGTHEIALDNDCEPIFRSAPIEHVKRCWSTVSKEFSVSV